MKVRLFDSSANQLLYYDTNRPPTVGETLTFELTYDNRKGSSYIHKFTEKFYDDHHTSRYPVERINHRLVWHSGHPASSELDVYLGDAL